MIAAAVMQVDPVNDFLDYANALAAFGGVALALFAQRTANRARREVIQEAAKERERTFRLELLRGLLSDLDEKELARRVARDPAEAMRAYEARLHLLGLGILPVWTAILDRPSSMKDLVDGDNAGDLEDAVYFELREDLLEAIHRCVGAAVTVSLSGRNKPARAFWRRRPPRDSRAN